MKNLPVISLVIPNLNCAEFLERTIMSVLAQNYPRLELIMSDGGSRDGSMEIVKRYRDAFAHVISAPDTGQANAVNKGFAVATGDVMGWINSDDILMPGGLDLVGSLFAANDDMEWLSGRVTCIDEEDQQLSNHRPRAVSHLRFLAGDYQWIQQESTFWRKDLWQRAGGGLDESLKLAVDGELWLRFSRHADMIPVHAQIGAFRYRKGQRSEAQDAYHSELLHMIELERQKTEVTDELTRKILSTPLKLRSRKETNSTFPELLKSDPKPLKRLQLWKHKLLHGTRKT